MKILHTADWHLGKKLWKFSRIEEQVVVLDEIVSFVENENIDIVLVAGDCFDQINPSTEAIKLFYETLFRLSRNGRTCVFVVSGNHDSPERIDAPSPLGGYNQIYFTGEFNKKIDYIDNDFFTFTKSESGFVELVRKNENLPLRLLLTPYVNELRLKQEIKQSHGLNHFTEIMTKYWADLVDRNVDSDGINLIVTHLLFSETDFIGESGEEKPIIYSGGTEPLKPECIPSLVDYVATGHLHRCHSVGEKIWYSGSPLAYSFSEVNQEKFVIILDTEGNGTLSRRKLPLFGGYPLKKKTFSSLDGALQWLKDNQECYVELHLILNAFLSYADQQLLLGAHSRCLIVPEVVGQTKEDRNQGPDLTLPIDELFKSYFQSIKNIEVNDDVMDMFNEVLATKDDT
ncbi:exonuclease subunit SbcD [bacterium]|jgi:DNA repair protein SbcD/Mre11|nr:exonuclease subunit SbcD [bacterium]